MRRDQWRSIRTIPTQTVVLVKTVSGIVCRATTYPMCEETRWVRRPHKRRPYYSVGCYRLRGGKPIGDVVAVAWMPTDKRTEAQGDRSKEGK